MRAAALLCRALVRILEGRRCRPTAEGGGLAYRHTRDSSAVGFETGTPHAAAPSDRPRRPFHPSRGIILRFAHVSRSIPGEASPSGGRERTFPCWLSQESFVWSLLMVLTRLWHFGPGLSCKVRLNLPCPFGPVTHSDFKAANSSVHVESRDFSYFKRGLYD
ncbi:hypothetical protein SEVIR_1G020200v4 [Setaria viridis]|uniref:Uncharacterized protein n=1 Tax=Setaria viridis TaxID=4556 RepID=A0A4U6W3S1_SETVI|nr:hypothetical protein SEVIR_1G020200v2 [Setaria viridis]